MTDCIDQFAIRLALMATVAFVSGGALGWVWGWLAGSALRKDEDNNPDGEP